MYNVFLSYSRSDYAFVQRLVTDLKKANINPWIDREGLKIGTSSWEQAIRDAIRDAEAVLLIASPESRQSRYVRGELGIAEMYQRPVFPVWASGKEWIDCVPIGLIGTQYADARSENYETALFEIIDVLQNTRLVRDRVSIEPRNVFQEVRNPYKGLRPFTKDDSRDFFGRASFVDETIETIDKIINTEGPQFLAIVGPSGSGKSSIVMAGLVPQLQIGRVHGSQDWYYADPVLPGLHPIESLAISLANILNIGIGIIQDDLERSSRGLYLLAKRIARHTHKRLILVVDQFEELFTQTSNNDERERFIELLVAAATEPSSQAFILVTIRADFYDRPMHYIELGKLFETYSRFVLPMTISDWREVIERPAALPDVGLVFEEGLVGDLLFEVSGQAGALPLLEFTLEQLAESREGSFLTQAVYKKLGGVRGALARHAEQVYSSLPSDTHRDLARTLFLRLIEPGANEQETTRRRAPFSELVTPDTAVNQILHDVTSNFTRARLLTANVHKQEPTIEVSHEALFREWTRLADWLRIARDDIWLQQTISNDAREWIKRNRREDDLYRGAKLEEALAWAKRNLPSTDEMSFIESAINLERRKLLLERRSRGIQQVLNSALAGTDLQTVLESLMEIGTFCLKEPDSGISVTIMLLLFRGDRLKVISSKNLTDEEEQLEILGNKGIIADAFEKRDVILADDVAIDPELSQFVSLRSAKSVLAVPIYSGFNRFGILIVSAPNSDVFAPEATHPLAEFGARIAFPLQNAVLYETILDEKSRIVSSEELARKKLARDLHDGPTQSVAAIAMRISFIRRLLDRNNPQEVQEELLKVEELARRTTKEIRHMLFTLRPLVLETQGLTAAIEQLIEKMRETHNMNIELQIRDGFEEVLTVQRQGVLFYIIEEAINNARKHAQAEKIIIRFLRHDEEMRVEVEDNGVGFDVTTLDASYDQRGSLGMINMRERAEILDGSLEIHSDKGKGTKITLRVPLVTSS